MEVQHWPTDKPIPYARNARKIPQSAIDKVAASIKEFGWRQPIVVDEDGVIIAGHTRLLAAQKLGLAEVPVHVARGLTPAQVKAYRLLDNRSHEEASWDYELLAPEIAELQAMDIDLALTGFDDDELAAALANLDCATQGLTDDDAVPEPPEVPVCQPGELWTLGRHKLLCGDATDPDAVARLMGSDRADLVVTDPPYNVDYEGYTEEKLKIAGDKMSPEQFCGFLKETFEVYRAFSKRGASLYVCHASSWQREFQNALEQAGFEVRCQIVWAKNTFAWGHGRYKFQHEPLFYAHLAGQTDAWYGDKSQSTLWMEKKPAANRMHPTMKPVELLERAIVNSSKAGDIVVDLFGGSGSTMIACEKTGRISRLMELDPRYAETAIRRWQDYTGRVATNESGQTLETLAAERQSGLQPAME